MFKEKIKNNRMIYLLFSLLLLLCAFAGLKILNFKIFNVNAEEIAISFYDQEIQKGGQRTYNFDGNRFSNFYLEYSYKTWAPDEQYHYGSCVIELSENGIYELYADDIPAWNNSIGIIGRVDVLDTYFNCYVHYNMGATYSPYNNQFIDYINFNFYILSDDVIEETYTLRFFNKDNMEMHFIDNISSGTSLNSFDLPFEEHENFNFLGFGTELNNVDSIIDINNFVITENVDLYLIYEELSPEEPQEEYYTLTINVYEGVRFEHVLKDSIVNLLDFVNDDISYRYINWVIDGEILPLSTEILMDSDKTINAVLENMQYTISFNDYENNNIISYTEDYGIIINLSDVEQLKLNNLPGLQFVGYSRDGTNNNLIDLSQIFIEEDLEFIAVYETATYNITIPYLADSGEWVDEYKHFIIREERTRDFTFSYNEIPMENAEFSSFYRAYLEPMYLSYDVFKDGGNIGVDKVFNGFNIDIDFNAPYTYGNIDLIANYINMYVVSSNYYTLARVYDYVDFGFPFNHSSDYYYIAMLLNCTFNYGWLDGSFIDLNQLKLDLSYENDSLPYYCNMAGWEFIGWSITGYEDGIVDLETYTLDSNITLTAIYNKPKLTTSYYDTNDNFIGSKDYSINLITLEQLKSVENYEDIFRQYIVDMCNFRFDYAIENLATSIVINSLIQTFENYDGGARYVYFPIYSPNIEIDGDMGYFGPSNFKIAEKPEMLWYYSGSYLNNNMTYILMPVTFYKSDYLSQEVKITYSDSIRENAANIAEDVADNVKETWEDVKDFVEETWDKIKDGVEFVVKHVKEWFIGVGQWFKNSWFVLKWVVLSIVILLFLFVIIKFVKFLLAVTK